MNRRYPSLVGANWDSQRKKRWKDAHKMPPSIQLHENIPASDSSVPWPDPPWVPAPSYATSWHTVWVRPRRLLQSGIFHGIFKSLINVWIRIHHINENLCNLKIPTFASQRMKKRKGNVFSKTLLSSPSFQRERETGPHTKNLRTLSLLRSDSSLWPSWMGSTNVTPSYIRLSCFGSLRTDRRKQGHISAEETCWCHVDVPFHVQTGLLTTHRVSRIRTTAD
jgi:hypothetical protein